MNQVETISYDLEALPSVVERIMPLCRGGACITFTGPLGAGKTTFIQALLAGLGVSDTVTSPTFAYMQTYTSSSGTTIHHFDLYRLEHINQVLEAGFDEYLYEPDSVVLIEWPEIVAPLLGERAVHIEIDYDENGRILRMKKPVNY